MEGSNTVQLPKENEKQTTHHWLRYLYILFNNRVFSDLWLNACSGTRMRAALDPEAGKVLNSQNVLLKNKFKNDPGFLVQYNKFSKNCDSGDSPDDANICTQKLYFKNFYKHLNNIKVKSKRTVCHSD